MHTLVPIMAFSHSEKRIADHACSINEELLSLLKKELGISWNEWLYSDISNSIYGVFLEFDINVQNYSDTRISFEDYSGKKMKLDLNKYMSLQNSDQWQKIRIPMKEFPIRKSDIDLKRIKSIVFAFEDQTKLKIDNIKLTN